MTTALLLLLQVAAPGAGSPAVEIPRVEEASVVIDGVLDEAVWDRATRLTDFWQYQPVDGRRAEEDTRVLTWYAPDAIYFGVIASDDTPQSIRATVADRDNLQAEDRVTIYLDTFNDRRRAFFFTVNPLGAQEDGVRTEGAVSAGSIFGGSLDKNPDYHFESSGRLTGQGYIVEIRIPFKSLRFPASETQSWGINVVRNVTRTGHEYTWTDARRASASFLEQSGTIVGLRELRRGVVTELQPFVTTAWNGTRDPSTLEFDRDDLDPSAGANLRVGLTSLSLDGTVNPDFSQVESDAGLVTANERFALFFPEKRPFFLEGIELFATPNQLVYSRQIGDPIAGGKVTGKMGRFGVAHITAVDDTDEGNAVFNVARIRRDVGANSLAAVTVTDRRLGDDYNTVAAADARIVFGGMYYVEGQLGNAWTETDGTSLSGPIWKAEFDRTGRSWGFNYRVSGLSDEFLSLSGFVPRTGFIDVSAFNRFTLYGSEGAKLENLTFFFGPTRLWNYDEFGSKGAFEGAENLTAIFTFRGGASIQTEFTRRFFGFDPSRYAGYGVLSAPGDSTAFAPADEVDGLLAASLRVSSPTFRSFNASARISRSEVPIFAEASEGNEWRLNGSVNLRPGENMRIGLTAVFSRITRQFDGSEFARTVIPRFEFEYQPTRALRSRIIAEYQSVRDGGLLTANGEPILVDGQVVGPRERGDLRLDLLLAYEPVVGTAAFLGYGTSMDTNRDLSFDDLTRRTDGFFLKLSYLFRM